MTKSKRAKVMKLDDYRKMAYKLVNLPPDYKGPVLLPSQLSDGATCEMDRLVLIRLGEQHLHLLNRRF